MKTESVLAVLVMATILLMIGKGAGVFVITWWQATCLLWVPAVGAMIVLVAWIILNMVKDFLEGLRG